MQERSTLHGNSRAYLGGLEEEGAYPSSYQKKGDDRLRTWQLVSVPPNCDYIVGTMWNAYDIKLTLKDGGWDDGMVFQHRTTGEQREIRNGRFQPLGQKS